MSWLYYAAKLIVKISLLLTRVRVKGQENIPGQGAMLVVANHLSLADPVILGVMLGRRVEFMAKEELFRSRFIGYFMRKLGAFPVHRGRFDREALRQAGRSFARGGALVMFPEGMRSKNARLQPAFCGSALIAHHNRVPVLPVGIAGTEKMEGRRWILHRPEVTVSIGEPFRLPEVNGRLTRAELAEFTEIMMKHIAELLPPEYRGNYGQGD